MAKRNTTYSFSGPRPSLIFSNRRNIRQIRIDGSEYKEAVARLKNAVSLDFDFKSSMIYWAEQSEKKIQRARFGQNAATKIVNVMERGLEYASKIAVDWVGRKIYWASQGTRGILLSLHDVEISLVDLCGVLKGFA